MNVIHDGAVSCQTFDCSPHSATATANGTVLRGEKQTLNKPDYLLFWFFFFLVSSKELNQEYAVVSFVIKSFVTPRKPIETQQTIKLWHVEQASEAEVTHRTLRLISAKTQVSKKQRLTNQLCVSLPETRDQLSRTEILCTAPCCRVASEEASFVYHNYYFQRTQLFSTENRVHNSWSTARERKDKNKL